MEYLGETTLLNQARLRAQYNRVHGKKGDGVPRKLTVSHGTVPTSKRRNRPLKSVTSSRPKIRAKTRMQETAPQGYHGELP